MVSKRMQLLLPRAFIGSPRPLGSGRSTGPPQLAHRLTRFSQSTLFSFFPPPPFHPYPRLSPSILSNTNPSQSPPLDQILSRRYDIFAKYECIPILMDPSIRTFREKVRLVPGKPPSLFSDPPFPRASRSGIVAPYLWRNRWELGIRAISLGRLCTPLTYGPEVAVRTGRPRQISLLIPRIFVSSCLASGPIPPGLSRNNRRDPTRR